VPVCKVVVGRIKGREKKKVWKNTKKKDKHQKAETPPAGTPGDALGRGAEASVGKNAREVRAGGQEGQNRRGKTQRGKGGVRRKLPRHRGNKSGPPRRRTKHGGKPCRPGRANTDTGQAPTEPQERATRPKLGNCRGRPRTNGDTMTGHKVLG